MTYDRERFIKVINRIREYAEFEKGLDNLSKKMTGGYYIDWYPPTTDVELCEALEAMFDDTTEAVQWFCYELDFGRLYDGKEHMNFINGKEFPLRNAGELYDYLVIMKKLRDNEKKHRKENI